MDRFAKHSQARAPIVLILVAERRIASKSSADVGKANTMNSVKLERDEAQHER